MVELIVATIAAVSVGVVVGFATVGAARLWGLGIDKNEARYKCHQHRVPRLGGISVALALAASLLVVAALMPESRYTIAMLGLTLAPAFLIGLLEDLFQNLGTLIRLLVTTVSAALGWWLLDASLVTLEVAGLDDALAVHPLVAFGFTLFAATGLCHAVNIVDGCNGLSSFVAIIVLSSIAAIAQRVDDTVVFYCAAMGAASLLGFFVWNFPFGRLFLGDGGAYLTGMLIAILSIMLVQRNAEVSPWFPLLLVMYPVWETVYSAYRRVFVQKTSPGTADRLHLHNLVYYRLVRRADRDRDAHLQQVLQSSMTSAHMWILSIACAIPALLFWNQTQELMLFCGLFALSYVGMYRSFVRFRSVPSPILGWRKGNWQSAPEIGDAMDAMIAPHSIESSNGAL